MSERIDRFTRSLPGLFDAIRMNSHGFDTAFLSDLHLGLHRKANFTSASSAAREQLSQALIRQVLDLGYTTICTGDLFDKGSNSEQTLLTGLDLAQRMHKILAGNHDVFNNSQPSSMDLLKVVLPNRIILGEPETFTVGQVTFFACPHALTQQAYDAMINRQVELAQDAPSYRVLLLHCMLDSKWEHGSAELNVSKDRLEYLLGHFHYIFLGHEHTPRGLYDNRVQMVGSLFPTVFDEAFTPRRLLFLNSLTGQWGWVPFEIPHWHGKASRWADAGSPDALFISLLDDTGKAQELAIELFEEGALGVCIKPAEEQAETQTFSGSPTSITNLPAMIEQDLTANHAHLVPLWKELSK